MKPKPLFCLKCHQMTLHLYSGYNNGSYYHCNVCLTVKASS